MTVQLLYTSASFATVPKLVLMQTDFYRQPGFEPRPLAKQSDANGSLRSWNSQ